jgi:hypothetical protein
MINNAVGLLIDIFPRMRVFIKLLLCMYNPKSNPFFIIDSLATTGCIFSMPCWTTLWFTLFHKHGVLPCAINGLLCWYFYSDICWVVGMRSCGLFLAKHEEFRSSLQEFWKAPIGRFICAEISSIFCTNI